MMNNQPFLTNQKLSEEQEKVIVSLGSTEDPVVFAVMGEISPMARYATVALLATHTEIFTYNFDTGEESRRFGFSEI